MYWVRYLPFSLFMYLKEKNSTRLKWYSCARYKAPGPLVLNYVLYKNTRKHFIRINNSGRQRRYVQWVTRYAGNDDSPLTNGHTLGPFRFLCSVSAWYSTLVFIIYAESYVSNTYNEVSDMWKMQRMKYFLSQVGFELMTCPKLTNTSVATSPNIQTLVLHFDVLIPILRSCMGNGLKIRQVFLYHYHC